MFEIGSSLREARERQKLELSEIERETRIRSKYLQALEEDRFDRLPAPAYAKGFLRTYADYLGLEAQPFVMSTTPTSLPSRNRRRLRQSGSAGQGVCAAGW